MALQTYVSVLSNHQITEHKKPPAVPVVSPCRSSLLKVEDEKGWMIELKCFSLADSANIPLEITLNVGQAMAT